MLGNLAVAKSQDIKNDKKDDSPAKVSTPTGGSAPAPAPAPAAGAATTVPVAPTKRPLGAKEPIPFQWKLMGKSHGFLMTLFKSIERDEVEAQYERIMRDGYYTNVEIVDIGAKIQQTKAAKAVLIAQLPVKKDLKPEKVRVSKAEPVMRIRPSASAKKAAAAAAALKAAKKAKKKKATRAKSKTKRTTKAKAKAKTATKKAKKTATAKATKKKKTTRTVAAKTTTKSTRKSSTKKTTKRKTKKTKK